MMNATNKRTLLGSAVAMAVTLCAWRALAQAEPHEVVNMTNTDSILYVMVKQFLANPASAMHIVVLSIVAFLVENTPWIKSVYIPHFTIIGGACTYWLFAGTASVAKCYPYPAAVLAANGLVCGVVAFGAHNQIVHRIMNWQVSPERAARRLSREAADV